MKRIGTTGWVRYVAMAAAALATLTGCAVSQASPEPPSASPSPAAIAASPTAAATSAHTPTPPSPTPTPGPARWSDAGDLVDPRGNARLVLAGGGLAVVVGNDVTCEGIEPGGSSVRTEVRDPAGAWREVESLPTPRDRFAVAPLPDGRVLVTGGLVVDADGVRAYSSTYLLDPLAGTWARSGLMTTARFDPAFTTLLDGRVLVAGGTYVDLPGDPPARVLRTAEVFDPTTEAWSRTGDLDERRSGGKAVTLSDGRVLLVGGVSAVDAGYPESSGPGVLATATVWDPATERWMEAGALQEPREGFALVALPDGGALVLGGRTWIDAGEFGFEVVPTSTVERWDARTGRWSRATDTAVAAAERVAIGLPDGRILVAGGDISAQEADLDATPDAYTADVQVFDPEARGPGEWSNGPPFPAPRAYAEAALLDDGSVLVATGFDAPPDPEETPACPRPTSETWTFGSGVDR